MHDTTVRTANFTECCQLRQVRGRKSRWTADGEHGASISHINATSHRHGPCWHWNQGASPDATSGAQASLEYD
jgi:hypothetical protein